VPRRAGTSDRQGCWASDAFRLPLGGRDLGFLKARVPPGTSLGGEATYEFACQ
jgi:hypothetical protein